MKHKDMPESFKVVLKEMCKRVKAPYTKINFDTPEWYLEYSWTEEEQKDFIEWMVDYLYNNSKARREILSTPIKNKKLITKAVRFFVFDYGWKLK